mmetsp:Transcript_11753/g.34857  ORF Transcript_11753/g.34857 Transcript_11753/m.34857 type:complete len:379 (+) Transcript_11753:366-1502(+)
MRATVAPLPLCWTAPSSTPAPTAVPCSARAPWTCPASTWRCCATSGGRRSWTWRRRTPPWPSSALTSRPCSAGTHMPPPCRLPPTLTSSPSRRRARASRSPPRAPRSSTSGSSARASGTLPRKLCAPPWLSWRCNLSCAPKRWASRALVQSLRRATSHRCLPSTKWRSCCARASRCAKSSPPVATARARTRAADKLLQGVPRRSTRATPSTSCQGLASKPSTPSRARRRARTSGRAARAARWWPGVASPPWTRSRPWLMKRTHCPSCAVPRGRSGVRSSAYAPGWASPRPREGHRPRPEPSALLPQRTQRATPARSPAHLGRRSHLPWELSRACAAARCPGCMAHAVGILTARAPKPPYPWSASSRLRASPSSLPPWT